MWGVAACSYHSSMGPSGSAAHSRPCCCRQPVQTCHCGDACGSAPRRRRWRGPCRPHSSRESCPVATFVLTWNPDRWEWPSDEFEHALRTTSNGRRERDRWSVGICSGGIVIGDRAFLLGQSRDRGIVAGGQFTSWVEIGPQWDGSGRETTYAQVEWDTIVEPVDRLPTDVITAAIPAVHCWDRIQGSGVALDHAAATLVEDLCGRPHRRSPLPLAGGGDRRCVVFRRCGHSRRGQPVRT